MAGQSTHARVVDAALRCLASEGLRRTTVDDVDLGSPGPLERLVERHVLPGVRALAGQPPRRVGVASGETVSTKLS